MRSLSGLIQSLITPLVCVMASAVLAQPPITVDWIQEELLWNNFLRGVRTSETGNTSVFVGGANLQDYPLCGTHVAAQTFSPSGEPLYPGVNQCLDVVGVSQMFCAYRQGKLVCMDIATSAPAVWVSGIHYSGWSEPVAIGSDPGTIFITDPSRDALIVSGGNFFLGGHTVLESDLDSIVCPDLIWKSAVVVDQGVIWEACIDHPVRTFEMWGDTLLAIGFPTVTKIDTANGSQAGTFDLFDGPAVSKGHTAISGDTLFWASRSNDLQVHVGRYLIGSGPVWEVTLPYTGQPVELFTDDFGRLWTAVGNLIIWMDQADGSHQSYAFGQVVNGIDMVGSTVAITGPFDGTSTFVIHGHVTP